MNNFQAGDVVSWAVAKLANINLDDKRGDVIATDGEWVVIRTHGLPATVCPLHAKHRSELSLVAGALRLAA